MYSIRLCAKEDTDDIDSETEILQTDEGCVLNGNYLIDLSEKMIAEGTANGANLCVRNEDGELLIYGPVFRMMRN